MILPVTGLDTLTVRDQRFILIGQGPKLRVLDAKTNHCLTELQIFDAQPIHLIAHRDLNDEAQIIVAGGRYVAILLWKVAEGGGSDLRVLSSCSLGAKEWILRTCAYGDSCLVLTTNNNLFEVSLAMTNEIRSSGWKLLAQGPGSFLYSGDVAVVSADELLVASGSVFGEVLVWTCQRNRDDALPEWTVKATHRFEGHTGSIFGVRISPQFEWEGLLTRFVASCSDDRTIQVWDVSDFDVPQQNSRTAVNGIDTGFGRLAEVDSHRVASGWGHQSRIWDVDFLIDEKSQASSAVRLISRGEDSTCQLWSLAPSSRAGECEHRAELHAISSDHCHSGKNIWSWCSYTCDEGNIIFTGGADGRVVLRIVPLQNRLLRGSVRYSRAFKELPGFPEKVSLKDYCVMSHSQVVAVTNNGRIAKGAVDDAGEVGWQISACDSASTTIKVASNAPGDILVSATGTSITVQMSDGTNNSTDIDFRDRATVSWLHVAGQRSTPAEAGFGLCVIFATTSGEAYVLWIDRDRDTFRSRLEPLGLFEHFVPTSSCYDYGSDILVLGSRAGAVAIYADLRQGPADSVSKSCVRHVHGSDAVTSLQFLKHSGNDLFILSTGRNGRYGIHKLMQASPGGAIANLQTVHSAAPPFGPSIEGAVVVEPARDKAKQELILYGFRSKDFVVWSETLQLDVFSVDCGGAHRSWAYRHSDDPGESGGTFVWTKAGTFNLRSTSSTGHNIVQTGGHGREIKAMAVCPLAYSDPARGLSDAALFATGAEDTTVRFFALASPANRSDPRMLQLCSLNEHSAGLQDLTFSPCGTYLFSCGGAEQLYVWRLSFDVPVVGLGVTLLGKMPQHDEDFDVRIMSLNVSEVNDRDHEAGRFPQFRVAAAYSNGKVKILQYDPSETAGHGVWQFAREVLFGTFCMIQVAPIGDALLTAGTNGFLNLVNPDSTMEKQGGIVMKVHQVHQSSILSMDVVQLSSKHWLAASGGDDNAFAVSLLTKSVGTATTTGFQTVRVDDAHAAALTTLKIFCIRADEKVWTCCVVTAGNDQRVQAWRIIVPRGFSDVQSIEITRLWAVWTAVADISCVDVAGEELLVTGVGIDTIPLQLDSLGLTQPIHPRF